MNKIRRIQAIWGALSMLGSGITGAAQAAEVTIDQSVDTPNALVFTRPMMADSLFFTPKTYSEVECVEEPKENPAFVTCSFTLKQKKFDFEAFAQTHPEMAKGRQPIYYSFSVQDECSMVAYADDVASVQRAKRYYNSAIGLLVRIQGQTPTGDDSIICQFGDQQRGTLQKHKIWIDPMLKQAAEGRLIKSPLTLRLNKFHPYGSELQTQLKGIVPRRQLLETHEAAFFLGLASARVEGLNSQYDGKSLKQKMEFLRSAILGFFNAARDGVRYRDTPPPEDIGFKQFTDIQL